MNMLGYNFTFMCKLEPILDEDGKVENVKNSMEKVLEDKVGQAFYPEEQEVAENATIEVDGNFVSLFLLNSEVEADAEKMYNNLIKK